MIGKRYSKALGAALAICVLLMAGLASAAQKTVTVEADEVKVRSGAGNYYEVTYIAGKGAKLTVLSEADGWMKVKFSGAKTGYVSTKSMKKSTAETAGVRYSKPSGDLEGVGKASTSEIMAATKGVGAMGMFARGYAKSHRVPARVIERITRPAFAPRDYRRFRAVVPPLVVRIAVPGIRIAAIAPVHREVGEAVAMRIVAEGVAEKESLDSYVSMVGSAVLEVTPMYDEDFHFIVLQSPQVRSFSTPAGYVFITTGALGIMRNEAELAGVLAHEIAHVIQGHGARELEKQKQRIQSGKVLDELDKELEAQGMDTGDKDVQEDLGNMADELYEEVISGRKRADEDEADRIGVALAYNAGYKADGLKHFLIAAEAATPKEDKTRAYGSASQRAAALDALIAKEGMGKGGKTMQERFLASTK